MADQILRIVSNKLAFDGNFRVDQFIREIHVQKNRGDPMTKVGNGRLLLITE